jgi:hypothetical protein
VRGSASGGGRRGLGGRCTFTVVDNAAINAFTAPPGCYVYVTRGLLAILNSEGELAARAGPRTGPRGRQPRPEAAEPGDPHRPRRRAGRRGHQVGPGRRRGQRAAQAGLAQLFAQPGVRGRHPVAALPAAGRLCAARPAGRAGRPAAPGRVRGPADRARSRQTTPAGRAPTRSPPTASAAPPSSPRPQRRRPGGPERRDLPLGGRRAGLRRGQRPGLSSRAAPSATRPAHRLRGAARLPADQRRPGGRHPAAPTACAASSPPAAPAPTV